MLRLPYQSVLGTRGLGNGRGLGNAEEEESWVRTPWMLLGCEITLRSGSSDITHQPLAQ